MTASASAASTPRWQHGSSSLHVSVPKLLLVGGLLYIPLLLATLRLQPYSPAAATFLEEAGPDYSLQRIGKKELEDRIQYLETKVNTYLAFGTDPFLSGKTPAKCQKQSFLDKLVCEGRSNCTAPVGDNTMICLDASLKGNSCIVYDFGIREEPAFGEYFATQRQCRVFAFDPSPITSKWYHSEETKELRDLGNYQLLKYGAGGDDEDLELRAYDWDQISVYKYPSRVVDPTRCNPQGQCKYNFFNEQAIHKVPVRKLSTILKDLGHDRVDIMKVDVEGSEYRFLEAMIEDGSCRKVEQLILEWHHFDFDLRYGMTSNPQINVLVALLKERCGLEQFWTHSSGGWPSNLKLYSEMGLRLYYNLASFKRTRTVV